MPVLFFCKRCLTRIWKGMGKDVKAKLTIAEAEQDCMCSDCETNIALSKKDGE